MARKDGTPLSDDERDKIKQRLEELREEIRQERISYGEIMELQDLAEHIEESDVELRQWAEDPEFPEDED